MNLTTISLRTLERAQQALSCVSCSFVIVVAASLLWIDTCTAQAPFVEFERIPSSQEPPNVSAFSLCEGVRGEMWVGGIGTITRIMDGIATHFDVPVSEARVKGLDQRDLPRVISLAYSEEGVLWVGTSLGLLQFDEESELFEVVDGHRSLSAGVYGIAFGSDQSLWLATKQSLVHLVSKGAPKQYEVVLADSVLEPKHVAVSVDGGVWCSTTRGVFVFDEGRSEFVAVLLRAPVDGKDPSSIRYVQNPVPVVSITGAGDSKGLAPRLRVHESEGLYAIGSGGTYYCRVGSPTLRCGDGKRVEGKGVGTLEPIIWANRNTMDLLVYDPSDDLEYVIMLPARLRSFLLSEVIASRSGDVWIASRNGVFVGSNYLPGTRWYPTLINGDLSRVRFPRGDMAVELTDGTIYACLGGPAIQSIKAVGEIVPDFRVLDSSIQIMSLQLDVDDNLWVATSAGIYRMLGDGPLVKLIDAKAVMSVLILGEVLWFIDREGLKRVPLSSTGDRLPLPELVACAPGVTAKGSSFSAMIYAQGRIWIVAGLSGIVWTKTSNPLIEHLECGSTHHAAHNVGAIDVVARGSEILTLHSNRLVSYDTDSGEMKSLHEGYRIGNIAFLRLSLDRHDAIWAASSKGLWRLDADGKRSSLLVNSPRVVDRYWSRMSLGASGSVLVGTKAGLLVVDPDRVGRSGAVRPTVEGVSVDGVVLDHRRLKELEILSGAKEVVVSLGTAGGFNRNGLHYRVEIRTAEAVRHELVTGPRLSLPRLPAGVYELSVQVGDADWGWSLPADLLSLRVMPSAGRGLSRLLIGGLAMLVISAISLSWWLRHRVVDRTFREKESLLLARHDEKEERVRSVAHDLRGPLAAVENLTEVLKIRARSDHLDTAKHLALLDQVQTGIRRIDDIVGELGVPLSQGEAQGGTNVAPCIDALEEALRVMTKAKRQDLKMDLNCDMGVSVPSRDLERIVQNLVHNATKFAPEDSTIDVQLMNSGERVLIRVLDRGPGIPSGMEGSVVPFSQTDAANQGPEDDSRPSGLGHWMIRNIVDKHDGKFWCENRDGGGATFAVSLPIVRPIVRPSGQA